MKIEKVDANDFPVLPSERESFREAIAAVVGLEVGEAIRVWDGCEGLAKDCKLMNNLRAALHYRNRRKAAVRHRDGWLYVMRTA